MRGVPSVQKAIYKATGYLKKESPTILTGLGVAGVVITAVVTARSTVKAVKRIEEAEEQKGEKLTTKEVVKVAGPAYIPAVIAGAVTITFIVSANEINKKRQQALIEAYTALNESYQEYRDKVKEEYGEEVDEKVREEIARDKKVPEQEHHSSNALLFFDEHSNRYFWKTMAEVNEAEYHLNRNFALRGYAELNEFYEFLGLGPTAYGAEVGWSMEAGEIFYGYTWIDFYHKYHEAKGPDKPAYYTIEMPFGPTADFMSY